jgi:ABC-type glucose/galactose transport system permease subunit
MPNLPPALQSFFTAAGVIGAVGFVLVIIFAVVILIFILRMFGRIRQGRDILRTRGVRVAATISDMRIERDMLSKDPMAKWYVYTAATDPRTGPLRTFTQWFHTPMYRMGDAIIVLVDPANPSLYMFT